MKKLLIVNNNMHIGGVQKSLVNLLGEIHSRYDVTLLLFYPGGGLMKDIPADVKVISPASCVRFFGMTKNDTGTARERAARASLAALTRVIGRKKLLGLILPFEKKLTGYDAVISYLHSGARGAFYGGCNEFALRCTDAKKKITFLHCDYGSINPSPAYNADIYMGFDAIAACSKGVRDAFVAAMPQAADKVAVVHNCHDFGKISHMADEAAVEMTHDRLNIVTVARFGREKGILRAIRAIASMGERASGVRYYVIGGGAEYSAARTLVASSGLDGRVLLTGELDDPYGYMRAADVLLIPSFSEAAPMVIDEAASLGTPILTTRTSSADEMVTKRGFGWVCDNSEEGIASGIERLIGNAQLIYEKKAALRKMKFDNSAAVGEFEGIIS